MQELASASRARDYINHLESKVSRDTAYYLTVALERELKQVCEIGTKIELGSVTVTLKKGLEDIPQIEAKIQTESANIFN